MADGIGPDSDWGYCRIGSRLRNDNYAAGSIGPGLGAIVWTRIWWSASSNGANVGVIVGRNRTDYLRANVLLATGPQSGNWILRRDSRLGRFLLFLFLGDWFT